MEFGSLADGVWTLTTDLTKVRNGANAAGTGTATTNSIRRLFGDVNGDGEVSAQDALLFDRSFGTLAGEPGYVAAFDWNNDGEISAQDALIFDRHFGVILP